MIAMAIYGWAAGDLNKIFRGTAEGEVCGLDGAANFPFMYFYNPLPFGSGTSLSIDTNKRVCVERCPRFENGALTTLNCSKVPTSGATNCNYDLTFDESGASASTISSSAQNFVLGYQST